MRREVFEAGESPVLAFYRRLGYAVDEAVPMSKRLIADTPAEEDPR